MVAAEAHHWRSACGRRTTHLDFCFVSSRLQLILLFLASVAHFLRFLLSHQRPHSRCNNPAPNYTCCCLRCRPFCFWSTLQARTTLLALDQWSQRGAGALASNERDRHCPVRAGGAHATLLVRSGCPLGPRGGLSRLLWSAAQAQAVLAPVLAFVRPVCLSNARRLGWLEFRFSPSCLHSTF